MKCECAFCLNQFPFEMPKGIVDDLLNNKLVLFAGAGISTENKTVFKETLYEEIALDLGIDEDMEFPDLMQKYCDATINGRRKLLEKIKYRFDYCHQFKELYKIASRFHTELAPFWMLKEIITTNWDDYFERKTGAIPIVTSEDFAFHDIDQRKVYKIHGSISNYGSIVATKDDYDKCYQQLNSELVGAKLKTLIATKTILFIGYSFRDFDFNKILQFLKEEMKGLLPHIYIVTLDNEIDSRLEGINCTVINTDGRFFFQELRTHLERMELIVSEKNIDRIYEVEYLLHQHHQKVSDSFIDKKTSNLIYCLFYQDGVQHAIDYLHFKEITGETYSRYHLLKQFQLYAKQIRKDFSKAKNYADLAYIDGYIEGLSIPLFDDIPAEVFPFYYLFGQDQLFDEEFFWEAIDTDTVYHRSAEKYGKQFFKDFLDPENDITVHHRPYIY